LSTGPFTDRQGRRRRDRQLVAHREPGDEEAGERDRGDQAQLKPGYKQPVRERPVVVTGRFEPDKDRPFDRGKLLGQMVVVLLRRHPRQAPTSAALRPFDQHLLAVLGHIDRYQHGAPAGVEKRLVMVGRPPKCCLDNLTLETSWPAMALAPEPTASQCATAPNSSPRAVREWILAVGAKTAFIEPGSPWENGYCESFNSKLRDELLNGKIFYSLAEARTVIESWRRHYNTKRPTHRWAAGRRRQKLCNGRLRKADQLRRPRKSWRLGRECTKIHPDHPIRADQILPSVVKRPASARTD